LSAKVYAFLDHPYSVIVAFLLMAIGIYFLTYIPDMLAGRSFIDVLNLQDQMYIYQSTLKATHPFSSPWYSWPFLFDPVNTIQNALSHLPASALHWVHVPLWLEIANLPNGTESTIVLLGNPALWWLGFAVIVGLTVFYVPKLFRKNFSLKKSLPAIFIITFFFFQWLPYILISRVVFIYHFYVNVPFLCLGSAFLIDKYWSNKWAKILAVAYFALVVALFVLFYPVISGVPTSPSTVNSLHWFGSWVF
jgi:dolichyl-phosphate-mannose--protein O-mannosyl transferase